MNASDSNESSYEIPPGLEEDYQHVLKKAGYHKFTLPNGLVTSGHDRSATANAIFNFDITGKSMLDIGCKHGFYCVEAMKRGAASVTGVEGDRRTMAVAQSIFNIYGFDNLQVLRGYFPKVKKLPKQFDVVLLLNVVHHKHTVKEATDMILQAAKATREYLVLSVQPPLRETATSDDTFNRIETMEIVAVRRSDDGSGKLKTKYETLLSQDYIGRILSPLFKQIDYMETPDYPGRFMAIAKR